MFGHYVSIRLNFAFVAFLIGGVALSESLYAMAKPNLDFKMFQFENLKKAIRLISRSHFARRR